MYQKVKLTSKRNTVNRIIDGNKTFILKEFKNIDDQKKEYEILCLLKQNGLNVPKVIDMHENSLLLQDLGDDTLLNWYENEEMNNGIDYEANLYKLCNWLNMFYSVTSSFHKHQYILWDVNFRNFIILNNEIYGIDFEQSRMGRIEEDAGRLSAFALTYDPQMTEWKKTFNEKFVNILASKLNLDMKLILSEMDKELKAIKERRNRR